MISLRSSLLALGALGLWACDLPLPPGAYEPQDLDVTGASAEAGMASPDSAVSVLGGMGGGTGGTMGGTTGGAQDAGGGAVGGGDAGPNDPLAALQGDYFVRVDQYNTSRGSGMTVDSHITSYLVARLGLVDGTLTMFDRQCYVEFDQKGATTTIPTSEQNSYFPAKRAVMVNFSTGKWNTERGPYAVGWDYDFTSMPDRAPPTSGSDPLVRDNNADGAGVNVKVTAGLTCNVRIVQKIDLLFSGMLAGGKLVSGNCTNMSEQTTLASDTLCPKDAEPLSNGPDTVRFAKASSDLTDKLLCPVRSVMTNALPTP